jgi:phosphatidylglycerophosphatase A
MSEAVRLTPKDIIFHPVHFLSLGLGSGLAPVAPGTAGTLVALLLYIPLATLPLWAYLTVLLVGTLVGIVLCEKTSNKLGGHDHPAIVWDEFLGYWLTMLFAPAGWIWMVVGFLLFRLFDIWKPWPVNIVDQNIKGGLGIMLDDLVAGIYALALLQLIYYFTK